MGKGEDQLFEKKLSKEEQKAEKERKKAEAKRRAEAKARREESRERKAPFQEEISREPGEIGPAGSCDGGSSRRVRGR